MVTRSGKVLDSGEDLDECTRPGIKWGVTRGGIDTPVDTFSQGPKGKKNNNKGKRVHFEDERVKIKATPDSSQKLI